jgi:hypothetical protein
MQGKSRQIQEMRPGDPTPPDILRQCEQIQAGWSASEREKRSRTMPGAHSSHRDPWEVPVVKTTDLPQLKQTAR